MTSTGQGGYERAAIADGAGLLGGWSRLNLDWVFIPRRAWLDGGELHYDMAVALPSVSPHHDRKVDPKGALDSFIRITDAEGVLRFALRFGVLGLCKHELPASHNPPPPILSSDSTRSGCQAMAKEPIAAWLLYVGQARALMNIAARLQDEGKPGNESEWRAVYARVLSHEDAVIADLSNLQVKALTDDVFLSRVFLGHVIDEWLGLANVRPQLRWDGTEPRFVFSGYNTFGALALQLILATTRSHGLAICSGCGEPYLRERKPQVGRRNYCPRCKATGVHDRERKRSWRRKEREDHDAEA